MSARTLYLQTSVGGSSGIVAPVCCMKRYDQKINIWDDKTVTDDTFTEPLDARSMRTRTLLSVASGLMSFLLRGCAELCRDPV